MRIGPGNVAVESRLYIVLKLQATATSHDHTYNIVLYCSTYVSSSRHYNIVLVIILLCIIMYNARRPGKKYEVAVAMGKLNA